MTDAVIVNGFLPALDIRSERLRAWLAANHDVSYGWRGERQFVVGTPRMVKLLKALKDAGFVVA